MVLILSLKIEVSENYHFDLITNTHAFGKRVHPRYENDAFILQIVII